MKLFSYVVARDYGFAPNPFYGMCTLACCKPAIRSVAQVGDWILGTGSAKNNRAGYAVYVMRITGIITFDQYWHDPQFCMKKPDFTSSKRRAYGDNIYHHNLTGNWEQANSHHSYEDGGANLDNLAKDTKTPNVLLSNDYVYWGGVGPQIPPVFRDYESTDIVCSTQGHKNKFPQELVSQFIDWVRYLDERGYCGAPLDWKRSAS